MSSLLFTFPSQLCNYDWIPPQFLGRGGNMTRVVMAVLEVRGKTVCKPDLRWAAQSYKLPGPSPLTTAMLRNRGSLFSFTYTCLSLHVTSFGGAYRPVCYVLPHHCGITKCRHGEVNTEGLQHTGHVCIYLVSYPMHLSGQIHENSWTGAAFLMKAECLICQCLSSLMLSDTAESSQLSL